MIGLEKPMEPSFTAFRNDDAHGNIARHPKVMDNQRLSGNEITI